MKILGIVIAVLGYVVAIGATFLLVGAAPPLHPWGTVPVSTGEEIGGLVAREEEAIRRYQKRSRTATIWILAGTSMQLIGTVVTAFAH